jgi:hypothetical protein
MDATVYLKWNGKDPIRARVVNCGPKVDFKNGDVQEASFKKAKHLSGAYKHFEIVEEDEVKKPKKVKKQKVEEVVEEAPVVEKEEEKEEETTA